MKRPTLMFATARVLALLSLVPSLACASVTVVTAATPIEIQAQPPAPPLPNLPPVDQPPPPPRVTINAELIGLDEPLTFDEAGALSSEHQDILAELAAWLQAHPEVLVLSVEAHSIGEGSKRVHQKLSLALAKQVVDALVAEGIDAARLLAIGLGKSADDQRHLSLRVSERAAGDAAGDTSGEEAQP